MGYLTTIFFLLNYVYVLKEKDFLSGHMERIFVFGSI